jgi:pSer/pThr/pTyr-binding forkhead associated (FHA) protein
LQRASLRVCAPGKPERVFPIEQPETLIGRSPSAHLCIPDESISREHAVILFEDDTFVLEDLQSTNGTRVNGKRIRTAPLADGDEFQLGQTRLRFTLG